jgi:hypothetical protein
MKTSKTIFITFLALTSVCAHAQVYNLDFEGWEDSIMVKDPTIEPNGFRVENFEHGTAKNWQLFDGVAYRTTDATNGNYAIVLNDW